jgi:hypothetical protein
MFPRGLRPLASGSTARLVGWPCRPASPGSLLPRLCLRSAPGGLRFVGVPPGMAAPVPQTLQPGTHPAWPRGRQGDAPGFRLSGVPAAPCKKRSGGRGRSAAGKAGTWPQAARRQTGPCPRCLPRSLRRREPGASAVQPSGAGAAVDALTPRCLVPQRPSAFGIRDDSASRRLAPPAGRRPRLPASSLVLRFASSVCRQVWRHVARGARGTGADPPPAKPEPGRKRPGGGTAPAPRRLPRRSGLRH